MPVVKADAYRHGAREVAKALEAEGAKWLAVSNVEEGVWLRKEGITTRILVMADFLPEDRGSLSEFELTPVIHSLQDLHAAEVPYHLKIDSGMGRLGTRAAPEEIVRAVASAPGSLEGVMTHFASSGNYESRQTEEQLGRFEAVLSGLRAAGLAPRYVHASGTIPIAYRRQRHGGNLGASGPRDLRILCRQHWGPTAPKRQPLDVRPALTCESASVLASKGSGCGSVGRVRRHVSRGPARCASQFLRPAMQTESHIVYRIADK